MIPEIFNLKIFPFWNPDAPVLATPLLICLFEVFFNFFFLFLTCVAFLLYVGFWSDLIDWYLFIFLSWKNRNLFSLFSWQVSLPAASCQLSSSLFKGFGYFCLIFQFMDHRPQTIFLMKSVLSPWIYLSWLGAMGSLPWRGEMLVLSPEGSASNLALCPHSSTQKWSFLAWNYLLLVPVLLFLGFFLPTFPPLLTVHILIMKNVNNAWMNNWSECMNKIKLNEWVKCPENSNFSRLWGLF